MKIHMDTYKQIGAVDWKHYAEYDADNFRAVHALLLRCFSVAGLSGCVAVCCSVLHCVALCCSVL